MRKAVAIGLALCALPVVDVVAARAGTVAPTADFDYTYQQKHDVDEVTAQAGFLQKYGMSFSSSLTSSYDLLGAVRLDLEDHWDTSAAATSRLAPTLELQLRSAQASLRTSYQGVISTTDAYLDGPESTTYSSSLSAEVELVPLIWPQTRLRYQDQRNFRPEATDQTTRTLEVGVQKDLSSALRVELNLKRELVSVALPNSTRSDGKEWNARTTYKEILTGDVEFEFAYEIQEAYKENFSRAVFSTADQTYEQRARTRMRKLLDLTPRMSLSLVWEYEFNQDLLETAYDSKVLNKYAAELRYALLSWVKLAADAKRDTQHSRNRGHDDDEFKLTDTLRFNADVEPVGWLRVSSRAEFSHTEDSARASGGSRDLKDQERYETILRNRFGDFWDLGVNILTRKERTNDWLTLSEGKFRADLALRYGDFAVGPTYEQDRTTEWKERRSDFNTQKMTYDAKIKFEWRRQFLDLLSATFSHDYGVKTDDALDSFRNFDRVTTLTEDTSLSLALAQIIPDLNIEGQVNRSGSDTEGDQDPMLVTVAYAAKLSYKLDRVAFAVSFKYNSKGNGFDDLGLNTRIEWRGDQMTVSGEYQFDKTFKDVVDETRKLGLKLSYQF